MRLPKVPIRVSTVQGPWVSLGFHIDFQRQYLDLHLFWWIITIGRDYYFDSAGGHAPT